jgi:hypothetical protein
MELRIIINLLTLFADDVPIPMLDPGRGRTKMGRLSVYAHEQRPWAGPKPPPAVYAISAISISNGTVA